MNEFEKRLNEMLVNTFRSVLKVEEKALYSSSRAKLSISELHLLEVVANPRDKELTISTISRRMGITLPSATVAINKLMKKGYLVKEKCSRDGRVIYVKLTALGQKMNRVNAYFHSRMIREVSKELDASEKSVLLKSLEKLNSYFIRQLENE